jgi:Fur family ferric uptake transcriptional regulator
MMVMGHSPADRAEQAAAHLLDGRVRSTAARRLVIRALAETGGPVTAADLHRALRSAVPLSSLYRTLAVLEQAGVLARQHDAAGVARYELAEWLTGHHHHLICVTCGEVRDVTIPPETEHTITSLVERIAGRAGYRVTGHRIDIEGRCRACRRP